MNWEITRTDSANDAKKELMGEQLNKHLEAGEVKAQQRSTQISNFGGVASQVLILSRDFPWERVADMERKSLKMKGR